MWIKHKEIGEKQLNSETCIKDNVRENDYCVFVYKVRRDEKAVGLELVLLP